jgi:hypothetical protein
VLQFPPPTKLIVYFQALYILIKLMEFRLKVLDNEENEKKISDLIIETRASVNKFKIRNQVHVYRVSIGYGA